METGQIALLPPVHWFVRALLHAAWLAMPIPHAAIIILYLLPHYTRLTIAACSSLANQVSTQRNPRSALLGYDKLCRVAYVAFRRRQARSRVTV